MGWINLTPEKVHPSFHRRFPRSAEGLSTVRLPSIESHDSYHQHKEEDCRPGGCTWQLEDHLRVREEDKSWSTLYHVGHFGPLLLGDVAQDGKGHTAGQQTCHRVHYTSDERVSVDRPGMIMNAVKAGNA